MEKYNSKSIPHIDYRWDKNLMLMIMVWLVHCKVLYVKCSFPVFLTSSSLNKGFKWVRVSWVHWTCILTVCRNLALYNFDTRPIFHPWISPMAGEIHFVNYFSTGGSYLAPDANVVSCCVGKNGHDRRLWSFFASSKGIWCWYFSWSEWDQGKLNLLVLHFIYLYVWGHCFMLPLHY